MERPTRSPWRWTLRVLGSVALTHWTVGIGLRLTLRDAHPLFDLAYYLTPPMLLALSAVGTVVFARAFRRGIRLPVQVAVATTLFWSGYVSFSASGDPGTSSQRDLRVVLWNLGRWEPRAEVATQLLDHDPDVIVLIEALTTTEGRAWSTFFEGYEASSADFTQILVLTRSKAQDLGFAKLARQARARFFRVEHPAGEFSLAAMDVASRLNSFRKEPIEWVNRMARQHEATLILGDFNTPSDSVHFDALREGWDLATDLAGDGYRPTWPMPFPVLDIDQVWVRRDAGVRVLRAVSGWSRATDHRPVIVDLRLGE